MAIKGEQQETSGQLLHCPCNFSLNEKVPKGKFILKHNAVSLDKPWKFVFVHPLTKLLAIPFYSFGVSHYVLKISTGLW